jgi:hypothetical protein
MTAGSVICDSHYEYEDGTTGQKLLIILNDGTSGSYLVLKTTSEKRFKGHKHGCQSADYYPNFYLANGSCCLKGESWVLLKIDEFDLNHFLQGTLSGRMWVIGTLGIEILNALWDCEINHEDIEVRYEQNLIDMQNKSRSSD